MKNLGKEKPGVHVTLERERTEHKRACIPTTVKNVTTRDIISVETTDSIMKAINLMVEKNIGSVVVTEDGKPVGMLTERDIVKKAYPDVACGREMRAGEMMSKPLITIEADGTLGQAALLMMKKDIRRLLVVEKGEIVGIVTLKDIMRGTLDFFMVVASI